MTASVENAVGAWFADDLVSKPLSRRGGSSCSLSDIPWRSDSQQFVGCNRPNSVYRLGEMPIQSCGQSASAPRGKAGARMNAHAELRAKRQRSVWEVIYRNRPILDSLTHCRFNSALPVLLLLVILLGCRALHALRHVVARLRQLVHLPRRPRLPRRPAGCSTMYANSQVFAYSRR